MEFAMGILGWTPSEFWASTMFDLMAAWTGHQKVNAPEAPEPMSRDEYEELKKRLESAGG